MKYDKFKDIVSEAQMSQAYRLIHHFDQTCRHNGIEYVMDGGMLIGSMLHHGRIPWDDDFDVYIRASQRLRAISALHTNGFVVMNTGHYSKLWYNHMQHVPNNRPWNWPFIDIGWLLHNGTHVWEQRSVERRYKKNKYPVSWIFPAVQRPFGPLVLYAPRKAELFLKHRFKKNWNKTCVANHWDHRLERWRYIESREDTRVACKYLNVDLVYTKYYKNGTSFETLSLHGMPRYVRRFENGSLLS